MAKPTVLIVGADKGGVGKTTVSRTVLDYFSARNVPIRAFDTEFPKGTLKRFHPDITEIVDVTQIPDEMEIFDTLSDTKVTLIDVRAGLLWPSLGAVRGMGAFSFFKLVMSFAYFAASPGGRELVQSQDNQLSRPTRETSNFC